MAIFTMKPPQPAFSSAAIIAGVTFCIILVLNNAYPGTSVLVHTSVVAEFLKEPLQYYYMKTKINVMFFLPLQHP